MRQHFFDETCTTPWGEAINFKRPKVRGFFTENALYWLNEFRFDGLRFDAVHASWTDQACPQTWRTNCAPAWPADRHVHLVLENDDNDARACWPAPMTRNGTMICIMCCIVF